MLRDERRPDDRARGTRSRDRQEQSLLAQTAQHERDGHERSNGVSCVR